jgi:hypothetical protein
MNSYLKTVHSTVTESIDSETGEVMDIQIKETKILTKSREEFIQLYVSIESKLSGLAFAQERLFTYCVLHCDRENIIRISSYDKKVIFEQWGLAASTIANSLQALIQAKLLIRIGRGTYRINPKYVWKGTTDKRKEMLTHVLTIECPHC